ncbi:MAG: acyl-CoA/acyl-ACP dehydrogenase, partial [Actinobacteria bacterium]|nr:acyl-CoA/acyl-ACP dehydrogenase [Actinomycetota bacterium]
MVDEDLNQVCDTARSIFEAACGGSQSRALVEQASSSRDLWDILSQAGWLGIALPRNFRQAGLGMAGLAVLAEEAGRFSVTAPLLSTAGFFVPMVLSAAGERSCYDLLKPVLNHGHPAAVAFGEGFARGGPGRTLPSWDGQRLVGVTRQVQDAQLADLLAVVAMTDSGEMALAIVDTSCDGVVIEPCFGADPTRPLANVHLDIEIDQDHVIAGDLGMGLRFSTLALAAEMVGIAQRCVEMSAEHAVNRVQFGRPIGSFQGIKHRPNHMALI